MRRTWASYHYTVHRVKLNERNIENERFAECILSDFWSEVKHLNVINLAHVTAIHLLRKIYQHFLLEGL